MNNNRVEKDGLSYMMNKAREEVMFYKETADEWDEDYSDTFDGYYRYESEESALIIMKRFGMNNTDLYGNDDGDNPYIIVKPYKYQRSCCLLLRIKEMLCDGIIPEIFLIYHRLEKHGKPFVGLRQQYDEFKKGMRVLNKLYPDFQIRVHEVKWYDEDPGPLFDSGWNEDEEMKDYVTGKLQTEPRQIDVKGIFARTEEDKEYRSSLYCTYLGWDNCPDGSLRRDSYLVDMNTRQCWRWSRRAMKEYSDITIDYPQLIR